jgi:hypothetical protein
MDRSFLSQPEVVAASRGFVCIRTLTYENAEEREFMRALLVGRSGEVENTTFCLLSPDGKRPLTRPVRGAQQVYRDGPQMAEWMGRVVEMYRTEPANGAKADPLPITALPVVAGVRLGLATASADNQPLVIGYAPDAARREGVTGRLARLAWQPRFIGRAVYALASTAADLSPVTGAGKDAEVCVVQPDAFGQKGTSLARLALASADETRLAELLDRGLRLHRPRGTSMREHMWAGQLQGVFWDTALPVTDPQEAGARERTRRFRTAPNP